MRKSIAFIALLVTGCATQDAHKAYFRAQEKIRQASEKVDPRNETLTKAYDALTAGRAQMLDARYDHALRNFNQSIKLSDQAMAEAEAAAEAAKLPPPLPMSPAVADPELAEPLSSQPAETAAVDHQSAETANHDTPRAEAEVLAPAEVPAQASASTDSLAEGEAAPLSLADDMPKAQATAETAKAQSVTEPKTKPKAQKSLQRKSVERSGEAKAVDAKGGVVIAPAKPSLKQSPSKELEKTEGSGDLAAEHGAASATQKEGSEEKRRRVPGVLSFIANDTSLLQETMTSLNQNCKFLLENPSTSLVLQGTHSGDEPRSLIDARFESIKAYMVGKGVPEDQIRLDEEKRRGASEFKLFVIEH